jgi:phosphatidylinositol alpha-mannosyltransferase
MTGGLRVAMVTEYAYPVLGGISEHVHFLCHELTRMGHDVTVVTSRAPHGMREAAAETDVQNLRRSGYRTVRIGRSVPVVSNGSIARITAGHDLRRTLARAVSHADVVHAQGLAPPVLALLAVRVSSAPCTVGTFHTYFDGGHIGYRLGHRYVASSLARLDRKIAVSQACVVSLEQYFPGPYDIVPNGIDTDLFRPLASEDERLPGPPRILFVGRFDPRNGLGTLIDAARILQDRGRDFEVQVVGDGPARPLYERHARRAGVWDRIRWLGLLKDERPELYRQATVYAAPCTLASFGVVLLEAFASGTPIVCADNIGFRQVLRDGAPGRFVPGHDPRALADGLDAVLADGALRRDWAVRGRAVAQARYSWPEVTRRIEAVYREVLAAKGAVPRAASAAAAGADR